MCLSVVSANRDVDIAGPIVRTTDITVCANPFVAPSERLFGEAEVI